MKKLIIATVALFCATALVVQAQDAAPKKAKKELTAEQQTLQKDMLAKYDADKNGKLDKTERAAMSAEDKAAWAKAFPGKKKMDAAPAAPKPEAGK